VTSNDSTNLHSDHNSVPMTILNDKLISDTEVDIHDITQALNHNTKEDSHCEIDGNYDIVHRIDETTSQYSEDLYSEIMSGTDNNKQNEIPHEKKGDQIYSMVIKSS